MHLCNKKRQRLHQHYNTTIPDHCRRIEWIARLFPFLFLTREQLEFGPNQPKLKLIVFASVPTPQYTNEYIMQIFEYECSKKNKKRRLLHFQLIQNAEVGGQIVVCIDGFPHVLAIFQLGWNWSDNAGGLTKDQLPFCCNEVTQYMVLNCC